MGLLLHLLAPFALFARPRTQVLQHARAVSRNGIHWNNKLQDDVPGVHSLKLQKTKHILVPHAANIPVLNARQGPPREYTPVAQHI